MTDQVLVAQQPASVLVVDGPNSSVALVATQQVATLVAVEEQGPAGPPGPGGFDTVLFVQVTPAKVWVISHALNCYPDVTLVDSAGDAFNADVRYAPDRKTITITLIAATTGTAYLN